MAANMSVERSQEGAVLAGSCVQRARDLQSLLSDAAPAIEAERELPASVLEALFDAQLFRTTLPRFLGGGEIAPAELALVAEAIAQADASTAWCLGQASGCAMSAAFMDAEYAAHVFSPRDAVLAWGAGAQGRAVACEGGYRISGRWQFASGSKHATWLGGHCKVVQSNGEPLCNESGQQVLRTALFPRQQAEMADDWHVMGLRGTRSEGYHVEDLFVEQGLTLDRDTPSECRLDAPLFLFTTTSVYAAAFSGVALGIARGALDDLLALARHKTPRGAASSMRDSPVVQSRLAELEAQLGSARAYQQQVLREVWEEASRDHAMNLSQRGRIRLATTYAINEATAVVEQVYRLAGATAIFHSRPFERRFRDAHAVSQQVQARFTNFETVGRMMLGLDVDTMFL